ncbi:DUF503 domain-containing protein [Acidobacteriota bacterium]
MIIGACSVELHLPYARSLKEKRMAIKGLKDSLKRRHNVSVAEVDYQDLWQRSQIAFVAVATDRDGCHKIISRALNDVESRFPEEILSVETEYF